MSDRRICVACDEGRTFDDALEHRLVPSNVRRFSEESFTVWRCSACGSLHAKEAVDLDTYYEGYPIHGHELDFWDRRAYANLTRRLRRAGMRRHHRILDHGCGAGQLVSYLVAHGYENVTGYDSFSPGWQEPTPLERQYDIVISQDVLEHADRPSELLRELVSLLRPGGLLSVGTPNADGIDLNDMDAALDPLHMPFHRHILSERALLTNLDQLGLDKVAFYRRYYYDTLTPTCNYRFLNGYVRRAGNVTDVAFEPARLGVVLTSPRLWLHALFGYLYPARCHMMALFRNP